MSKQAPPNVKASIKPVETSQNTNKIPINTKKIDKNTSSTSQNISHEKRKIPLLEDTFGTQYQSKAVKSTISDIKVIPEFINS